MARNDRRRSARSRSFEDLEGRVLLSAWRLSAEARGLRHHVHSESQTSREHSIKIANVPYINVGGRTERLDIYLPSLPAPAGGRPTILAIHGGGWHHLDKNEYGPRIAARFNPLGYVVVAMDYAQATSRQSSWPAAFEDVRASVRWVKSHASTYGIDPNRLVAFGESAGGNLAEQLGTNPDLPGDPTAQSGVSARVQAVVSFYGPSDLNALVASRSLGSPAAVKYLGGFPTTVPQSYHDASPLDHVTPSTSPMILLHGTDDTVVPFTESRSMASALSAAGVMNRLILVRGASHGFEFQPSGLAMIPRVVAFLNAALDHPAV